MDALSHLPIILIPGEEVTTYWGHANMWGLREWIDFRCADEVSIDAVRRYVLQKGGLISVNHPKCVGPPWLFKGWDGYPSMEVWQAPWRFYNWESLERWDALLRKGERVVAVGGSDVHSIHPPSPATRMASPTQQRGSTPNRPRRPSTPSARATSTSPTPRTTRSSS